MALDTLYFHTLSVAFVSLFAQFLITLKYTMYQDFYIL